MSDQGPYFRGGNEYPGPGEDVERVREALERYGDADGWGPHDKGLAALDRIERELTLAQAAYEELDTIERSLREAREALESGAAFAEQLGRPGLAAALRLAATPSIPPPGVTLDGPRQADALPEQADTRQPPPAPSIPPPTPENLADWLHGLAEQQVSIEAEGALHAAAYIVAEHSAPSIPPPTERTEVTHIADDYAEGGYRVEVRAVPPTDLHGLIEEAQAQPGHDEALARGYGVDKPAVPPTPERCPTCGSGNERWWVKFSDDRIIRALHGNGGLLASGWVACPDPWHTTPVGEPEGR